MTLSEELTWRGFVNQTTFKDIKQLDGDPLTFYWGVDPSASSMQVGNLAAAMMVRRFIDHGHKAVLLVGGATGMIGDPDGKAQERTLKSLEEIAANKAGIIEQYRRIFGDRPFEIVDNYDWFKDKGYLEFLRDIGKHVPMRQMLARDFVQARLGEDGAGISYAEFSYVLIQGYDFLHLFQEHNVTLQVCGSDQWGNSIAGVELIRRTTGKEAHVWSTPLVINKATGKKFGKSEEGAVWLDAQKTSVYKFYQFWLNADDGGVEGYLRVFTELGRTEIEQVITDFSQNRSNRGAQKALAYEVTKLVHGSDQADKARAATQAVTGETSVGDTEDSKVQILRDEIPYAKVTTPGASVIETLVASGLAPSNSEARRLIDGSAVYINGGAIKKNNFSAEDFKNGRLILRKGKKFADSALIELVS